MEATTKVAISHDARNRSHDFPNTPSSVGRKAKA